MPSPCIGACRAVGGICLGCGRTLTEIANWGSCDPVRQQAVMDEISGASSNGYCARCGAPLTCSVSAGGTIEQCWCSQTRPLPFDPAASGCLCRRCHGDDQVANA